MHNLVLKVCKNVLVSLILTWGGDVNATSGYSVVALSLGRVGNEGVSHIVLSCAAQESM
jgi:hypothetical protein